MAVSSLPRHTLVWPSASGWTRMHCDTSDDDANRALALWFARDWPLVVRRRDTGDVRDAGIVALGLPLPPTQGKRRLKLRLPEGDIARHSRPPSLAQVVDALPVPWVEPVAALVREARAIGLRFDVFGSAAWEWLTGLPYLREHSDLDLLCHPRELSDIGAIVALLERWERASGLRADGEIVFPDGAAVAWREWRSAPDSHRVLVKQLDRAMLVPRQLLLKQLNGVVAA